MGQVRSVAVFCGSRHGHDPAHTVAARALGAGIAAAGWRLVYGGGGVGLMGEVADAAIGAGGEVIGVIPEFLTLVERPYPALARLEVVPSMHVRKTRMFDLADAFVVLSGGLGTLDEAVEIMTWKQLHLHAKPLILVDVAGWAQPLLALIEAMIAAGFIDPSGRALFRVASDPAAAIDLLHGAASTPAPSGRL